MPTFHGSHPATYGLNYVWDVGTLSWVKETQPGGGVGAAVTIVDGGDVTQGLISDAAVTGDNPGTLSAKLRGLNKNTPALGQAVMSASVPVTIASNQTPVLVIAL